MKGFALQFTKVKNGWVIDDLDDENRTWIAKGDYCYYEITEVVRKILEEFEENLCQRIESTKMP